MRATANDLCVGVRQLGLASKPVCVHASLRSFGAVEGGPEAVVQALLDEGCTILVPAFSWEYAVPPLRGTRIARNGYDYDRSPSKVGHERVYTAACDDIDNNMGMVARAVLSTPGRARGGHPLCSFAALGTLAHELIDTQTPEAVFAPLAALAKRRGHVLLMGVGLEAATLLHLAELQAGRKLFRRWARSADGSIRAVQTGGCSDGFPNLAPALASTLSSTVVGRSEWRSYDAAAVLDAAAGVMRRDPMITHCADGDCERCNDAVRGGPMI